jgi:tetratricopeptide (TPR) repeat protein
VKTEEDDAAKLAGLERAVQERPMAGEAWAKLGAAYADAGQHELAASALRRATHLAPAYPSAWDQLSVSLAELKEDEAALHAARKAAAYAPERDCFWPRLRLGRLLLMGDRPYEAIRFLEEARERAPSQARVDAMLGIAYSRTEQYGPAAECLERALRWQPDDDPILWTCLGVSLEETGRPEAAVWALETAVFARPDYGRAWGYLGRALRVLERHEDAVRAFEKSVEHGFAPPALWADLGNSAAEVRDLERLKRACCELGRLDAELAKPLRRRLRALRATERARAGGAA